MSPQPCGPGIMINTRKVTKDPAYGGKPCPYLKAEKNCKYKDCPVDCAHKWSQWSQCSKTCGGGYSQRKPLVSTKAAYGGKKCPGQQQKACNTDYCPVDCYVSLWQGWSPCDKVCRVYFFVFSHMWSSVDCVVRTAAPARSTTRGRSRCTTRTAGRRVRP